jgi:hypothetical protein
LAALTADTVRSFRDSTKEPSPDCGTGKRVFGRLPSAPVSDLTREEARQHGTSEPDGDGQTSGRIVHMPADVGGGAPAVSCPCGNRKSVVRSVEVLRQRPSTLRPFVTSSGT